MTKIKIGFVSDTHVGYEGNASLHKTFGSLRTEKRTADNINIRRDDVNKAFSQAMDIFKEEEVELVMHAGDGMNFWGYKHPSYFNFYMEQVKKITENNIRYFEISGNHNFAKKKGVGCELEKLNFLPNAKTFYNGKYELHEIKGTNIVLHALPSALDKEKFTEEFYKIKKIPGKFNILMSHCGLSNIEFYAKSSSSIVLHFEEIIKKEMDLVLLGDYHHYKQVHHNIFYPGPTERFSFAESQEKPRVMIFEIDDETGEFSFSHRFLDVRPMIDLPIINAKDKSIDEIQDEMVKRMEENPIKDAIVRMNIEKLLETQRHKHLLFTEKFIKLREECLIFKLNIISQETVAKSVDDFDDDVASADLLDSFENYANTVLSNENPNKNTTIIYGKRYLKEVIENETY